MRWAAFRRTTANRGRQSVASIQLQRIECCLRYLALYPGLYGPTSTSTTMMRCWIGDRKSGDTGSKSHSSDPYIEPVEVTDPWFPVVNGHWPHPRKPATSITRPMIFENALRTGLSLHTHSLTLAIHNTLYYHQEKIFSGLSFVLSHFLFGPEHRRRQLMQSKKKIHDALSVAATPHTHTHTHTSPSCIVCTIHSIEASQPNQGPSRHLQACRVSPPSKRVVGPDSP